MSDECITNRTGEYLKFHADAETEEAALPYRQLPEYKRFEKHWQAVTAKLLEQGIVPSEHERNIAENWFMWGWCSGRLTP